MGGDREVSDLPHEIAKAVEEVAAEFELSVELEEVEEGRWIAPLDLKWTDVVRHAAYVYDVDGPLLAAYVTLELGAPEEAGGDLLVAVARANSAVLPGAFELDVESVEVRYRAALWPMPSPIETQQVAQLLAGSLQMAEAFAPAFRAVIDGADPIDAIDSVGG